MNKLLSPIPLTGEWGHDYANVSSLLYSWLFDPSSLTARLKANCRQFRVEVVFEQQILASALTEQLTSTMEDDSYWLRQVLLMCDNEPWVFASTVIPNKTIKSGHPFLAQLGSQPLGEALFCHPAVSRGNIEVKAFNGASHSFSTHIERFLTVPKIPDTLWGRRSIFNIDLSPLMVTEIFLPACIAYHA
ncbi:chorismate--pyruvate lyase family protein [Algibacillus agarilyticus]|uniref:chorismate--pyruvate lyase family protein n=1 Tax=Algibacillus agarilyticus TaxID=2234133 RepID=UPI000DD033E9|nr:chorismate lyase [Algibacillus agarilyticus]